MGLDILILILWILQGIILIALAAHARLTHRRRAAIGLVVGAAVGALPLPFGGGLAPMVLLGSIATVILVAFYGFGRRWIRLILLITTVALPTIVVGAEYPFAFEFVFAPLLCALAGKDILGAIANNAVAQGSA